MALSLSSRGIRRRIFSSLSDGVSSGGFRSASGSVSNSKITGTPVANAGSTRVGRAVIVAVCEHQSVPVFREHASGATCPTTAYRWPVRSTMRYGLQRDGTRWDPCRQGQPAARCVLTQATPQLSKRPNARCSIQPSRSVRRGPGWCCRAAGRHACSGEATEHGHSTGGIGSTARANAVAGAFGARRRSVVGAAGSLAQVQSPRSLATRCTSVGTPVSSQKSRSTKPSDIPLPVAKAETPMCSSAVRRSHPMRSATA